MTPIYNAHLFADIVFVVNWFSHKSATSQHSQRKQRKGQSTFHRKATAYWLRFLGLVPLDIILFGQSITGWLAYA